MNRNEMKVMISQPMTGLSDEEVIAVRNRAKEKLLDAGYVHIMNGFWCNDASIEDQMHKNGVLHTGISYLGKALEILSKCDAVYFCKGWENSKGCRIEHETAVLYGLTILHEV